MTRNSILTMALASVLVSAWPTRAQQFQTKDEYDAYMALYNEEDPTVKLDLGEAFIREFAESEYGAIAHQLLVATHYSQRDWRGVVDVAKRFDRAHPDAANDTRTFIYRRAMAAAQQERNAIDILDFGDKILELDRNNLGALLTLPAVILENLPEFGSARENNLARAFELANRARIRAQAAYPPVGGDAQQSSERVQVFSRVHLYLGQVHELRGDDDRAASEYTRILDYDPRSSDAYLRLGLSYHRRAAAESELLERALERADAAAEGPAEGAAEDADEGPAEDAAGGAAEDAAGGAAEDGELDPASAAIERTVLENLDLAIDYLTSAAALGGQAADLARAELEPLYAMRNGESMDGLEDRIRDRRVELTR